MKLTGLVLGAILVSGCLPMGNFEITETGHTASFAVPTIVSGNCGARSHQNLIGQNQSALAAVTLPEGTRIIRPGTAFTRDAIRTRLNVGIAATGEIVHVACG